MKPGFPLPRTPYSVLKTIIDVAEPKDVVTLSMCSEKMWRLIKFIWNKKIKYELAVNPDLQRIIFEHESGGSDLIRCFNYSERNMTQKTEHVKIMGRRVLASFDDCGIRTYWMDKEIGLQRTIDYICDLFTMNVHTLLMINPKFWFIEYIKNRQTRPLDYAFIGNTETLTEEEIECILSLNSNDTSVYAPMPENFQFNGNLPKCDFLHFQYGHWVTLDHLTNSEIIELSIFNSKLKEHEMNQFLKHLMTGGCPQLRVLSVEIDRFDLSNVFLDLWDKVVKVTEKRRFQSSASRVHTIEESYDIMNNDETVATIFWLGRKVKIAVGQDRWLPN